MFEYIGEMAKDYIYAVTPLLEDALMDRDLVHRQVNTAGSFLRTPLGSPIIGILAYPCPASVIITVGCWL